MVRICRWLLVSLLLVCLPGAAQTNAGRIAGAIYDPSGAPVPECLVTAANSQTGLKHAIRTEHRGYYVFAALPAGVYLLTAEKPGFRATEQSGIVLDAASQRSIDFHLEVGAVSESVSVSASLEQVQTSSGDVGRVITDRQLSQIALNGRNYAQLLRLIPGTMAVNLDPFSLALQVDGQRINGIRSASTYLLHRRPRAKPRHRRQH